jgi:hypothetical protein
MQVLHGNCEGYMLASAMVLLPLRRLQGEQAATTLFQVVRPPRDRGIR